MQRFSTVTGLVGVTALALALTGCGQSEGGNAAAGTTENGIQVVASTNVYGEIAETIGGDRISVTSIVDSLSQDPHSYEATVQDKLVVSEAQLLIGNGGGYDPFLERLADEVEHDSVISAVSVAGLQEEGEEGHEGESEEEHAAHGSFNEHVWYDVTAMGAVAEEIGAKLAEIDPDNAETYKTNVDEFTTGTAGLADRLTGLKAKAEGRTVAITEPVPVYLLDAAGLENITPGDYSEAIEEGSDVSVAVLNEMMALMEDDSLAFLAYNEQTESQQTQSVRDAADAAGVHIVTFTETVPEGEDFLTWMSSNVDSIESALNP
ncbi:metal ABC transporter solute-binding protein, Zn/Mn family [Arthrobacter sp. TMN-50]